MEEVLIKVFKQLSPSERLDLYEQLGYGEITEPLTHAIERRLLDKAIQDGNLSIILKAL